MATEKKTPAAVSVAAEATYAAEEFAKNAGAVFGKDVSPDIVRAAFVCAKSTSATKSDAVKIVRAFCNKEVK